MKTTMFSALSRFTLRLSMLLIATCIANPSAYAQLLDSDNDGMPDEWEIAFGLNSSDAADVTADPDADGLNNLGEYIAGTNPNNPDSDFDYVLDGVDIAPANPKIAQDSDADGLPDSWEAVNGLDPLFPDDASYLLHDGDGLTVLEEYLAGTNFQDDDSDNDGVLDGEDAYSLQSAYQYDTDSDGLPDSFELQHFFLDPSFSADAADDFDLDGLTNLQEFTLGLNLEYQDSDFDGVIDGEDVEPLNPRYRFDSDNDGLPDAWEMENYSDVNADDRWRDFDGDDATNIQEYNWGTSVHNHDTDGDGLPDGSDHFPLNPRFTADIDRDGIPNEWEWEHGLNPSDTFDGSYDNDGDELSNTQEFILGTSPELPDSDFDSVIDGLDLYPLDPTRALDSDNDGLPDSWEVLHADAHGSMINGLDLFYSGDASSLMGDEDGLTALEEYLLGTDFRDSDTDNDGLYDDEDAFPLRHEYQFDSDLDGLPDSFEEQLPFLNPNFPGDAFWDDDFDGLINLEEFTLGTDLQNPDTDNDGVFDGDDIAPLNARYQWDDDGDGLPNRWEDENGTDSYIADDWLDRDYDNFSNGQEYRAGTFANNPDSDNDYVLDGEDHFPLNPRYTRDKDRDGMPWEYEEHYHFFLWDDYIIDGAEDYDGDGLINSQEFLQGTLIDNPDTDYDGVVDGEDAFPLQFAYKFDSDSDGLPDAFEDKVFFLDRYYSFDAIYDFDGDGLTNFQEFELGTDLENPDSDFDDVFDGEDFDPTNPLYSFDYDGDGLPDRWEYENGSDPWRVDDWEDGDHDGFSNAQEYLAGTSGLNPDSDGDGYFDGEDRYPLNSRYTWDDDNDGMPREYEERYFYFLSDRDSYDSTQDYDGDGLNNGQEFLLGTSPENPDSDFDTVPDGIDRYPMNSAIAFDSDRDGLPDSWEIVNGLDPYDSYDASIDHHDFDSLTVLEEYLAGTDFRNEDTDGDGVLDDLDIYPLQAEYQSDMDQDGLPDAFEELRLFLDFYSREDAAQDFDNDGLTNLQEFELGTDLENPDSDEDGVPDGEDIEPTNPLYSLDSDGDGLPDEWEIDNGDPWRADDWEDFDDDGLTNAQEYQLGTMPWNRDTDGDYVDDGIDRFPLEYGYTLDNDNDGIPREFEDLFPFLSDDDTYDSWEDYDGDGLTNAQEFILGTALDRWDTDFDEVGDNDDLYPLDRTRALDSDQDGLADGWEIINGLDPFSPEDASVRIHDDDNLTVLEEYLAGTDIRNEDSDGDGSLDGVDIFPLQALYQSDSDFDGLPDAFEELFFFLDQNTVEDASQDFDNDGLTNIQEFIQGTDIENPDSDVDGVLDGEDAFPTIPHYFDISDRWRDSDGDGLTDLQEDIAGTDVSWRDSDFDGEPDGSDHYPLNPRYSRDSDRDGMPDEYERLHSFLNEWDTYDGGLDQDRDQLNNSQEFFLGTLLNDADSDYDGVIDGEDLYPLDRTRALDSDGDGLPDGWEVINGLDPFDGGDAVSLADDTDSLTVLDEYLLGTNFRVDDTDGDGVPDDVDVYPLQAAYQLDSDSDGMPDVFEERFFFLDKYAPTDAGVDFDDDGLTNLHEFEIGADPENSDSDFDGVPDGEDILPLNPLYYRDEDRDGLPNNWEYENATNARVADDWADPDGDRLTTIQEYRLGTDPNDPDSDRDGLQDGLDHFPLDSQYSTDYDRDGMPAKFEQRYYGLSDLNTYDGGRDDDGDQISNSQEFLLGTLLDNFDTDRDGVSDGEDLFPLDRTRALDSDLDGLPDGWEVINGLDPFFSGDASELSHDVDNLTVLEEYLLGTDFRNADSDNDGALDSNDVFPLLSAYQADSDLDGLPDGFEDMFTFLDRNYPEDAAQDFDDDGLANLQEYELGTDPGNPDSDFEGVLDGEDAEPMNPLSALDVDQDGLPDRWERENGTDPYFADAWDDLDRDNVSNGEEYKRGTLVNDPNSDGDRDDDFYDHFPFDPRYVLDQDRDGMPFEYERRYGLSDDDTYDGGRDDDGDQIINSQEFILGTSPDNPDTDFDGVIDGEDLYPLDHTRAVDSDQDGLPDGWEVINGLDPLSPDDASELSHDADSLTVLEEYLAGTDFRNEDSDGDSVLDGLDAYPLQFEYQLDSDSDGLPDAFENQYSYMNPNFSLDAALDWDGDGLTTLQEFEKGTDVENPDSDSDGVSDRIDRLFSPYPNSDADNDGLLDLWEYENGSDPYQPDDWLDLDGDYLTNAQEYRLGTDASNPDTDGDFALDGEDHYPLDSRYSDDFDRDGIPSLWEDENGLNGGDALDAIADPDNDGVTNLDEYLGGTDPQNGYEYPGAPVTTLQSDIVIGSGTGSFVSNGDSSYVLTSNAVSIESDPDSHFVYTVLPMDGEAIVQMTDINGGSFTRAGLMIRDELTMDSPYAVVAMTQGKGTGMFWVENAGDSEIQLNEWNAWRVTQPYWLRIVRAGNEITGYRSKDAVTWDEIETVTVALNGDAYVGLGFYGNNSGSDATVSFNDFSLTLYNQPPEVTLHGGVSGLLLGDTLIVGAVALDEEDGDLSESVQWSDGTDTSIGETFGFNPTSIGEYQISASVTDSFGSTTTETITVNVVTDLGVLDDDNDGLSNSEELALGTDPLNADTDGDGLLDGDEVSVYGSNPFSTDSDADGLEDGYEVEQGYDPAVADSDADADGDGVSNLNEYLDGTDPHDPFDFIGAAESTLLNAIVVGDGEGSYMVSGENYTLTSNTVSIEYDPDSYFVYTTLSGDGEAIVRMTGIDGDSFTRGGLMIRDDLTMDSSYAVVAMTQGKGTGMFWVESTGGASTDLNEWNAWRVTQPYWLRLVRSGNIITGYRSKDTVTWGEIGAVTVEFTGDAYIGLGFYGNNNGQDATVSFENFSLVAP